MKAKYIGPEYEYEGLQLEKEKIYDVEVSVSGPQIMINGKPVYSDDSSVLVQVEGRTIPYAPNLIGNHWENI